MKKLIAVLLVLLLCLSAGAEEMISASGAHALYLDNEGRVWAWGSNQKGESDPESGDVRVLTPRLVFRDTKYIACGRQFSARIDSNGRLTFWGRDCENLEAREGAVQVSACEDICAWVLEGGAAYVLKEGTAECVFESGIVATACGAEFVLFMNEAGECYIKDSETRLLMSGVTAISANGQTGMLLKDGSVYVFGASGSEGRLGIDTTEWLEEPVSNGVSAVIPVPGVTFSGALSSDGQMYVWGSVLSYMTAFDENGDSLASLADGYLICYGKTPIALYQNVKRAAIGDAFAVLLLNDGSLMTWGSNDQGQCGDGYYTACYAQLDADEEEGEEWEVIMESNDQRIFPVYLSIGE